MTEDRYAPGPGDAAYRPPPLAPQSSLLPHQGLPEPLPPTAGYPSPNQGTFHAEAVASQVPLHNPSYPFAAPAPPPQPHDYAQAASPGAYYGQPPPPGEPNYHGQPPPPPPPPHEDPEAQGGKDAEDKATPWVSLIIGVAVGFVFNIFAFCALCCIGKNDRRKRLYYSGGVVIGMLALIAISAALIYPVAKRAANVVSQLKKPRTATAPRSVEPPKHVYFQANQMMWIAA